MIERDDVLVRSAPTSGLTAAERITVRDLLVSAFGPGLEERFTDADWDHAVGGMHFLAEIDGSIVAHASVVERAIEVGGVPLRTGYVEAVAVVPGRQGEGIGTRLMEAVDAWLDDRFELGVLGTGRHTFYGRLGWRTWRGRAFVRTPTGPRRTPDEEGDILVRSTRSSPALDLDASISCDWRPGDVW